MRRSLIHAMVLGLVLAAPRSAFGQQAADTLWDRVLRLDSLAFAAVNEQDLPAALEFFSTDLEFYHDQDGLSDYAAFVESLRQLFAAPSPPTRTLLPGSTHIYPVPGYGAIQTGTHQFCHREGGTLDCGVFGFTHVWKNQDGRWQITRVLSYGHDP